MSQFCQGTAKNEEILLSFNSMEGSEVHLFVMHHI